MRDLGAAGAWLVEDTEVDGVPTLDDADPACATAWLVFARIARRLHATAPLQG